MHRKWEIIDDRRNGIFRRTTLIKNRRKNMKDYKYIHTDGHRTTIGLSTTNVDAMWYVSQVMEHSRLQSCFSISTVYGEGSCSVFDNMIDHVPMCSMIFFIDPTKNIQNEFDRWIEPPNCSHFTVLIDQVFPKNRDKDTLNTNQRYRTGNNR